MNNLFADFKRSFERLNGKPERTLEKTRELVLLHWGTLGLYLLGCLAVAVSFQEVGFFPLFALATAGGFWYSWQRAGKPRRRDDVLLGACIALVLLMIYGVSLGRLFTAANVATILASLAAGVGVAFSYSLKWSRDYRFVQCISGTIVLSSALSLKAICLPFIALYLLLLLPVMLQSNLEHLRRRGRGGSLTQAVQGKGIGVLATYILPALVLLVAAAVLYQFIPKPLRKPPDKPSSSQVSGTQSPQDGSGSSSSDSGSGSSGGTGTGSGGTGSGASGSSGSGSSGGTGTGGGSGTSGTSGTSGSGSGSGTSGTSGSGQSSGGGTSGTSGSGSGSGTSGSSGSGQSNGGGTSGSGGSGVGNSGSGGGSDSGSSRELVNKTPPKLSEEDRKSITKTIYIIVIALLLALLLATAVYYIRKWLKGRKKEQEPLEAEQARRAAFKRRQPYEFVCLTYAAMCLELARLGFPRAPSDTPGEYLWLITQRVPSVEREAGDITQALMQVLYAGQVPEAGILTRLDALLTQIRGKVNARLLAEAAAE